MPGDRQGVIRAGAAGCCAAKISEAEAFAANGVRGLLVTTAGDWEAQDRAGCAISL